MDNNVLAKVGNIEITKQHLINILRTLPQQQAMEVSTPEGAKRLLDEMIAGELLYLDALENNLEKDEEYQQSLEDAKHGLLQRYAIQKLLQPIEASEDELKAYFENNKSQFTAPEKVKAKHILVDEEETAKKVKDEIDNGADFSEVALKYSTCPSKERGGDLGYFERGKMVPEFEAAAFELKEGELSDLVKTQFGYHLIMVEDKIRGGEQTFEEVVNEVKQRVLEQKQGIVYENTLKSLKKKYPIEVNEEAFK